jgi:hypothetical protein
MMSNKVRYVYLRDSQKFPVGCVAIKLDREASALYYQVSIVNPADRRHPITGKSLPFNRDVAKHLALGRLVEKGLLVYMSPTANMNQVSTLVMTDLASFSHPLHRGDIPTRAIKAAKLWLRWNKKTQGV